MTVDHLAPSVALYIESATIAERYDDFFAHTKLFLYDTAVLDELLPRPCRLIDLGSGTGRHVVHFARRGFDVTGVDLSQHMLILTAAKCNANGVRADLHQLDLADLSHFPDGSFDAATCMFSTIGMMRGHSNRVNFVRDVHRILRPGGLFVFHAHNRWHNLLSSEGRLWLLKTLLFGWTTGEIGDRRMHDYRGIPDMFLHVFSLGELRRLVAAGGMSIERIFYLNELRDDELPPRMGRSIRANGFIVACRRSA